MQNCIPLVCVWASVYDCDAVDSIGSLISQNLQCAGALSSNTESDCALSCVPVCLQISQVYQSIELSRLAELAFFASPTELERVVVNTAKTSGIQVCVCVCTPFSL